LTYGYATASVMGQLGESPAGLFCGFGYYATE
jgi:hypothetical protein